ncbi:MAG: hypothetical protein KatS3mg030_472 [Saprospiraceae bacterium]|nr:MAG: hypothetical protein KatS3mg030_472 [Saprospiraceae bacterium]
MKHFITYSLFACFIAIWSPHHAQAASRSASLASTDMGLHVDYTAGLHANKTMDGKKEKKLEKWKKKLSKKMAKWSKKAERKAERRSPAVAGDYLTLCIIFFLLALIFFAIGGPIFGIFGSVTALAAAVFFVLWLLDYTGNL